MLKAAIRGSPALGVVLVMLVVVLMLMLAVVLMTDGRRERTRCNESQNNCREKNPHDLAHTNSPCIERQTPCFPCRFRSPSPRHCAANEWINTPIWEWFRRIVGEGERKRRAESREREDGGGEQAC
jgi:hypothetical protein